MLPTLIITGIITGAIYALLGLGLVVIYRTSQIVNFAQGDMATAMTFVAFSLLTQFHIPYLVSFITVLGMAFVFGLLVERAIIRPVSGSGTMVAVGITLGFSLVLNGVSSRIWGTQVMNFPAPTEATAANILGVTISGTEMIILGVTAACVLALFAFFRYTRIGIAMRATSEDRDAARLMGINVGSITGLSWGMAGLLGAMAGMLISPMLTLTPNQLDLLVIRAFAAVVIGGFTSMPGAVLGGLLIGVAESLTEGYVPVAMTNTLMFFIIMLVLVFRPNGLLGRHEVRRSMI